MFDSAVFVGAAAIGEPSPGGLRRGDGELVWIKPLGETSDEEAASRYFEKQMRFDPDLWIVEIEDREGRAFVDEPIV